MNTKKVKYRYCVFATVVPIIGSLKSHGSYAGMQLRLSKNESGKFEKRSSEQYWQFKD